MLYCFVYPKKNSVLAQKNIDVWKRQKRDDFNTLDEQPLVAL
jgi:GH25 family lysozyme M1 (1,4-beta-N-acetylmuramidase)